MDLFSNLTTLVLSQESAFVAGVIASFTPCILAIIPVFLYRFGIWSGKETDSNRPKADPKKLVLELVQFIAGFFVSLIITGLLLNQLTNSTYVNAVRLTLSFVLILVGILQLFNRANIQVFNKFTNPLMLGLVTPFIVSLSPCVLPYFSVLLTNNNVLAILPKFILFGLGILTPPILIALLGNFALNLFRRSSRILGRIERWSPILLLLSGVYLGSQLIEITQQDVLISGLITLAIIGITAYNTFKVLEQRTYQNIRNFLFVGAVWTVVMAVLLSVAPQTSALTQFALINYCAKNGMNGPCLICTQAEILFTLLAVALGITIVRSSKKGRLLKLSY